MQVGETGFEFGVNSQRRKSPACGGTDHGALARLTTSWQQTCESGGGNETRDSYGKCRRCWKPAPIALGFPQLPTAPAAG